MRRAIARACAGTALLTERRLGEPSSLGPPCMHTRGLTEIETMLEAGADVNARQDHGLDIQRWAEVFDCPLDHLV